MSERKDLEALVVQVRRDILRMVHEVNSGHPGGSLGCTEFFVAMYNQVMELKDTFDMDGMGEDLFFLSNGHISPVYYSVLSRRGFFPLQELNTFRKINSRLQGHPATHEGLPGIRIASGSLGQGMSVAIGAALAKKLNGDQHLVSGPQLQLTDVCRLLESALHIVIQDLTVSDDLDLVFLCPVHEPAGIEDQVEEVRGRIDPVGAGLPNASQDADAEQGGDRDYGLLHDLLVPGSQFVA